LCEAASITTRYHEDDQCWIADCVICRVPMVVWRMHDSSPPNDVREELLERLRVVADSFFVGRAWHYDDHMRRIPDHYLGHARAG
jgi:hypothetical protein